MITIILAFLKDRCQQAAYSIDKKGKNPSDGGLKKEGADRPAGVAELASHGANGGHTGGIKKSESHESQSADRVNMASKAPSE